MKNLLSSINLTEQLCDVISEAVRPITMKLMKNVYFQSRLPTDYPIEIRERAGKIEDLYQQIRIESTTLLAELSNLDQPEVDHTEGFFASQGCTIVKNSGE